MKMSGRRGRRLGCCSVTIGSLLRPVLERLCESEDYIVVRAELFLKLSSD